jgi:enamine deaminase RidA (YjgF/YER057c/UK114 family)
MSRQHISTGSPFEEEFAYSRAVVQGDWCFVAGTTGYDYSTMEMPGSALEQARNALRTIGETLAKAGFEMADIIRVQHTIIDPSVQQEIAPALQEALGDVRPAGTMVVAGLVAPEMKIEIEVTALKRSA